MAFTYSGAPSTGTSNGRRDAVRLLLKDLTSATALYADAEIGFFLTHHGNNVWRAAASAAQGLSARTAESKSVGDLAISGFGKSWRELAIEYNLHADRHVVSYAGGLSISDKDRQEDDTDRVQPAFTRTLFRNPLVPNAATGNTTGST